MAGSASKALKILHVIDSLNPGGAERMLVTAANIFSSRGYQADVLTIVKPGPLAQELLPEIKVFSLGRKHRFDPVSMFKLSRICRSYDIIHVHLHYNVVYTLLCKLIFPFRSKLIFHEHLGDVDKREITFELKMALKGSYFIGVSRHICEWAIKKAGVAENKVFLLPNTIIRKKTADIQNGNQNVKLVVVSNIIRNKQLHLAIEILKALNDPQAELHIYGSKTDAVYFSELQELINKLSLQNRVQFIHDCTDIQSVLPAYNLALHTSKSESGPLVLIEFLSQGLPFIAYKTGEVTEQVRADLPEFIMDNFDIVLWAERAIKLVDQDRKEMKNRLSAIFDKHYSEETYYNSCLNIYRTILAS